jgi:hypothetical protein
MATSAAAAKHLFISTSRFRDLVAGGVITHQPNGKYDLEVVREQYIRNLQKVSAGRGGDGGAGLAKQRTRLEAARTEAAEFKNSVNRRDYVSLAQIGTALDSMFGNMRELALSTPGKIADSLTAHCREDRAAIFEIVNAEIRDMLSALSMTEIASPRPTKGDLRRVAEIDAEAKEELA